MKRQIPISCALLSMLLWPAAAAAQTPPPTKKSQTDVGETYNPLLAEKDIEVGLYYYKTKNYDAAIERLQSAVDHRPDYAKPRWYLAEAFAKKGDYAAAIEQYRAVVEIMKSGKMVDQAQDKITNLTKKLEQKEKSRKKP